MSRRELSDLDAVTHSYFEVEWVSMAFGGSKKCTSEVDNPLKARTWASKKYVFEVDDVPEAQARASNKIMFSRSTQATGQLTRDTSQAEHMSPEVRHATSDVHGHGQSRAAAWAAAAAAAAGRCSCSRPWPIV